MERRLLLLNMLGEARPMSSMPKNIRRSGMQERRSDRRLGTRRKLCLMRNDEKSEPRERKKSEGRKLMQREEGLNARLGERPSVRGKRRRRRSCESAIDIVIGMETAIGIEIGVPTDVQTEIVAGTMTEMIDIEDVMMVQVTRILSRRPQKSHLSWSCQRKKANDWSRKLFMIC